MQFTHEHDAVRSTLKRFIAEEINPHVDAWEAAELSWTLSVCDPPPLNCPIVCPLYDTVFPEIPI